MLKLFLVKSPEITVFKPRREMGFATRFLLEGRRRVELYLKYFLYITLFHVYYYFVRVNVTSSNYKMLRLIYNLCSVFQ